LDLVGVGAAAAAGAHAAMVAVAAIVAMLLLLLMLLVLLDLVLGNVGTDGTKGGTTDGSKESTAHQLATGECTSGTTTEGSEEAALTIDWLTRCGIDLLLAILAISAISAMAALVMLLLGLVVVVIAGIAVLVVVGSGVVVVITMIAGWTAGVGSCAVLGILLVWRGLLMVASLEEATVVLFLGIWALVVAAVPAGIGSTAISAALVMLLVGRRTAGRILGVATAAAGGVGHVATSSGSTVAGIWLATAAAAVGGLILVGGLATVIVVGGHNGGGGEEEDCRRYDERNKRRNGDRKPGAHWSLG